MSVPVDKRTQGKLTVCVEAQQLAKYTLSITTKRVVYWADKTIKVKNLLRAWKDSDNKRFK